MRAAAATFAAPALPASREQRGLPEVSRCRAAQRGWRCSVAREDPYESRLAALARWKAAEAAHCGGVDGFRTLMGRGAASAIGEVYPTEARVLVLCGTGGNGDVGLRMAGTLSEAGFATTAYFCGDQRPRQLVGTRVEHLPFVPSTAEYYFDLAVDAVLGIGYNGKDVSGVLSVPYEFVVKTTLPVVSLDVPSGWDVDEGPRDIDRRRDEFVKPKMLVSLGRPKKCARKFAGALHYVYDWDEGGEEAKLFASNARAFTGGTGEVYGRPGMFQATLFTKREEKRVWVYTDDEREELWDELD